MGLRGGGLGLGFVSTIILTRLMEPDDFGRFSVAMTICSLVGLVSLCGLDHAAIRFVAEYNDDESRGVLASFEKWLNRTVLGLGVGAAACTMLITWIIAPQWLTNSGLVLLVCGLPALNYVMACRARLIARGHAVKGQVAEQLLRPLVLIAGALIVWFWLGSYESLSPLQVAGIVLAAFVAMAIWQTIACRGHLTVGDAPTRPRQWFGVALPLMIASGTLLLMNRTDLLLIATLMDDTSVATYTVAIQVATALALPLLATQQAFSRQLVTGDKSDLAAQLPAVARRIACIAGLTSLMLYGCLVLVLPFLLPIFGPTYTQAAPAIWILGGTIVVSAFLGPSGKVLGLNDRHNVMAILLGGAALANVGFSLLFIPLWGLVGAALSTACSMLLWKIAAALIIRHRFGFLMPLSGRLSPHA